MDHLRELASVLLEREHRNPNDVVVAGLRKSVSQLLAKTPKALELWTSGLESERRRALVELLWTDPAFAAGAAQVLGFFPAFIQSVAEDIERAATGSDPRWPGLAGLGFTRPPREGTQYRQALHVFLLENPPKLARAAEILGSPVPFGSVLARELDEIAASRLARYPGLPAAATFAADPFRCAERMGLFGLALSGGGIRSATFNLGVLQALADLKLLRRIDLLSTVSGGGYIGGWLSAWIKRHPDGVRGVEGCLSPQRTPNPGDEETWPVSFLRKYSNYLTPRLGFFSADTWTLVTTWVRNTLLNQSVLVLFLGSALFLPHVVVGFQAWSPVLPVLDIDPRWAALVWLGLATAVLVWLSVRAGKVLRDFDPELAPAGARWSSQGQVQRRIVFLALLAGIFASSFLASWLFRSGRTQAQVELEVFLGSFALFALALGITQGIGGFGRCFPARPGWRKRGIGFLVWLIVPLSAALGATIIWLNIGLFTNPWFILLTGGTWGVLVLGPPLLMQCFALSVTLQQGLLGRHFPDERREWWSRAGAWVLIYSFGWLGFVAVAILVPFWLLYWVPQLPVSWSLGKKVLGLLWVAITTGGVLAARSPSTGDPARAGEGGRQWVRWLPIMAPYVFIVGLAVLLSLGVFLALARGLYPDLFARGVELHSAIAGQYWCLMAGAERCGAFVRELPWLPRPAMALLVLIAGGLVALLLAWRVDVNEFSMHHFYKNRLVRCYLGGPRGRAGRNPNPFTGFDSEDDIPLARLHRETRNASTPKPDDEAYDGPYPVINTALNLVTGENLAWQERKAASFVFTPHYSGFEVDREPGVALHSSKVASDGYRPTAHYAYPEVSHRDFGKVGGIHLGTALAISGAAANPNMGYHSSSAAAFLMTVFNVRLGWWMGNPRHRITYRFSSPRILGLAYLLNELTGNSDDRSRYVNLSDGGHFDNLGLYELVRRRCRWIVVCDAEQDAGLTFGGLGNAIRKCRADFGVEIDLRPSGIRTFPTENGRSVHCAVGSIRYLDSGPVGQDAVFEGKIVYLKSSLTGDEPSDVLEYRSRQPGFPHQSTGDQWFDESQFESYRALGHHVATQVLGPKPPEDDWNAEDYFEELSSHWNPAGAAVEQHSTPALS